MGVLRVMRYLLLGSMFAMISQVCSDNLMITPSHLIFRHYKLYVVSAPNEDDFSKFFQDLTNSEKTQTFKNVRIFEGDAGTFKELELSEFTNASLNFNILAPNGWSIGIILDINSKELTLSMLPKKSNFRPEMFGDVSIILGNPMECISAVSTCADASSSNNILATLSLSTLSLDFTLDFGAVGSYTDTLSEFWPPDQIFPEILRGIACMNTDNADKVSAFYRSALLIVTQTKENYGGNGEWKGHVRHGTKHFYMNRPKGHKNIDILMIKDNTVKMKWCEYEEPELTSSTGDDLDTIGEDDSVTDTEEDDSVTDTGGHSDITLEDDSDTTTGDDPATNVENEQSSTNTSDLTNLPSNFSPILAAIGVTLVVVLLAGVAVWSPSKHTPRSKKMPNKPSIKQKRIKRGNQIRQKSVSPGKRQQSVSPRNLRGKSQRTNM
jgi:hypothetical protein